MQVVDGASVDGNGKRKQIQLMKLDAGFVIGWSEIKTAAAHGMFIESSDKRYDRC